MQNLNTMDWPLTRDEMYQEEWEFPGIYEDRPLDILENPAPMPASTPSPMPSPATPVAPAVTTTSTTAALGSRATPSSAPPNIFPMLILVGLVALAVFLVVKKSKSKKN